MRLCAKLSFYFPSQIQILYHTVAHNEPLIVYSMQFSISLYSFSFFLVYFFFRAHKRIHFLAFSLGAFVSSLPPPRSSVFQILPPRRTLTFFSPLLSPAPAFSPPRKRFEGVSRNKVQRTYTVCAPVHLCLQENWPSLNAQQGASKAPRDTIPCDRISIFCDLDCAASSHALGSSLCGDAPSIAIYSKGAFEASFMYTNISRARSTETPLCVCVEWITLNKDARATILLKYTISSVYLRAWNK